MAQIDPVRSRQGGRGDHGVRQHLQDVQVGSENAAEPSAHAHTVRRGQGRVGNFPVACGRERGIDDPRLEWSQRLDKQHLGDVFLKADYAQGSNSFPEIGFFQYAEDCTEKIFSIVP